MRGDFTEATKNTMAKRVGHRCSNPRCGLSTSGPQDDPAGAVNVGVAAHIIAASEDGPRGDSSLSLDERRGLDNGIWLCQKCHKLVDNDPLRYTVEVLRDWRARAEQRARDEIESGAAPPVPIALVLDYLPSDPGCFGRVAKIRQIHEQLRRQNALPIVSIHGMGGVGKTTLGLHVAHSLIDPKKGPRRFQDARLYVDLRGTDPVPVEPIDALINLLDVLMGPDPSRPRDLAVLAGLWHQAVSGKDACLFLDNAYSADQVRALLPGSPTCAVLITSDRRFDLDLMAGELRLDLDPMQLEEARGLLQVLAPRLDAGAADRIAALCGRLPLALRTAGSYLGLNEDAPLDEYIAGLEDSRTQLAQSREPGDPYFDAFATISLSVDRLDVGLRRSWALLSLFPAPFDRDAAASLWGEVQEVMTTELAAALAALAGPSFVFQPSLQALGELQPLDKVEARNRLQELRNRSLVSYDGASGRYFQHDLVRLAAARAVEDLEGEDVEAARQRLARHYLVICRSAKALYNEGGEDLLKGLALFDRNWPHIRAWQAWAASHVMEDQEAAHLCNDYPDAASDLLLLRLHPREWSAWLEAGLRAARHLGDRLGEANHLGSLSLAYRKQRQLDRAEAQCRQALDIARDMKDRRNEGKHLNSLGNIYLERGELAEAIGYFQQALAIERERAIETGDRKAELVPLGSLGIACRRLGKLGRAARYFTEALEIARDTGEWYWEGVTLGNLGDLYVALGDSGMAIKLLGEALEMERPIDDPDSKATWLASLGRIYRDQGDTARARNHWNEALAILETIEDPRAEGIRLLLDELED